MRRRQRTCRKEPSDGADVETRRAEQFGCRCAWMQYQAGLLENTVKAYQILFILWIIVFAFWLVRQFSEHNKRTDR